MMGRQPDAVADVKIRRDAALRALTQGIPYARFIGVDVERRGDEVTVILPFSEQNIGNPALPAIHGGVTAAVLEITSILTLSWQWLWDEIEQGVFVGSNDAPPIVPQLPKTIDFTIDYLRTGLPRDIYARATVTRSGRRYASVQAEAWQDNRSRPIAQSMAHFLMPAS